MRIGIITGEYPPMQGGVGAYSHILAHELAQQEQAVFVFSGSGTQDESLSLANSVQHWSLSSLLAARKWARENRLDVVSLQFQTAAYAMSPWVHFLPGALWPTPVVTTFHDLRFPYLFPKAGRLRDWIVMRLARASAGVIVTNHEDQARLSPRPNCSLIPIGSNILSKLPPDTNTAEWRSRAGADVGDFLIAYFGLFNHSKGIENLLNALAQLRHEAIPARLVMMGGAGSSDPTNAEFFKQIQHFIQELGLQPYIHQTGFINEELVGAYLTASDVVALPFLDGASYRRGSLMAAIHYHRPIVTTQPQCAIPRFKDGENMLLVPVDDVSALAAALRRLYQSPELRAKLSAGTQLLAGDFEWPEIARETIAFFQQVVRR
jgi:glycosyltransferase involved in cell wall biosynthesis